MTYDTDIFSIFNLKLDPENPRFIVTPNPTQEEIRSYLLEFEEISILANGINDNEGLMIGERVIIYKENGENIVLEGNRRICACQLLLNRTLIPEEYKQIIPVAREKTKLNISSITVDIAQSREEAQAALATRHIDGIRQWSTISKQKFFANSFNGGKTIDFISKITNTTPSKVSKGIKDHNLLKYALELPQWSIKEKSNHLNIQMIKPSIYLKAFTTKSEILGNISTRDILKLSFNEKTLMPTSGLPTHIFQNSIYLIAKAAYIDKTYNTRKTIDDVPGFTDFIQSYYNTIENTGGNDPNPDNGGNNSNPDTGGNDPNPDTGGNDPNPDTGGNNPNPDTGGNDPNPDTGGNNPIPDTGGNDPNPDTGGNDPNPDTGGNDPNPDTGGNDPNANTKVSIKLLSDLTWSGINSNVSENVGILNLCNELREISAKNHYKRYPIATTILIRGLLEQTLIYHSKQTNVYDTLIRRTGGNFGRIPPLEKVLDFYNNNLTNRTLFPDPTFKRVFTSFYANVGTKDYMDMVIHNPDLVSANPDILDNIIDSGLGHFIKTILNNNYNQ